MFAILSNLNYCIMRNLLRFLSLLSILVGYTSCQNEMLSPIQDIESSENTSFTSQFIYMGKTYS